VCVCLEFQKRVISLLAKVLDTVERLGKSYEPEGSDFDIPRVTTLQECDELEDLLTDDTKRQIMVCTF